MASDDNVQFYWAMLSVDIENEDHAIELLKEIIGLWVTMRGFSIAGCWLEQYKQATKTNAQKGLRRELKRNSKRINKLCTLSCCYVHIIVCVAKLFLFS